MAGKRSAKRGANEGTVRSYKTPTGKTRWETRWTYADPETGEPRRGSRSFDTEKLARTHLRIVTTQVVAKTYVAPTAGTVAEWLELWMAGTIFGDLKPQTQGAYRRHVAQMIPRIGHLTMSELNAGHLNAMYAELLKTGNHTECCKKKRPCGSHIGASGLSKTSVRHYHATLASALKAAVEAKRVPHAVTTDARQPSASAAKEEAGTMTVWSKYEARTYLELTADDSFWPIWLMLLTTGCRRGEILGMRWSALDWDEESITLQQTVGTAKGVDGKRRVITQNSLKGGGGHLIALDPATMKMLRKQRKAYLADRLRFGDRWQDNDLIFYRGMGGVRCSNPGAPLDGEAVSRRWIETLQRVMTLDEDVKRIRLHDTRHTWASLALKSGVPVKVVQERLGHKHPSITQNIYQHVAPGMDREAANKVASMFT